MRTGVEGEEFVLFEAVDDVGLVLFEGYVVAGEL